MKENIHAHVNSLDEGKIQIMPWEAQLAYLCPLNLDEENWTEEFADKLRCVVHSQQIHTWT